MRDGPERRSAARRRGTSKPRNGELAGVHRGQDDSVDLAVDHRLEQLLLELVVSLRLCDEKEIAALAGGFERAFDEVAGERRSGDRVRDEADRVRRTGAKAARDDVRPVAGLLRPLA